MDLRRGILFDLDGTLVDTNYLHTLAWSRAIRDSGEWAPMHAIHRLIGMGGDELVVELLGHANDEAVARRPVRYRELIDDARAFPGATELLARARAKGLANVLASSAPRAELDAMLALLDAGGLFEAVTSADDVQQAKPNPEIFHRALARGGLDKEGAVVIGDSVWDVEAAHNAGLGCIGLESGGFSADELERAGALAVYRDVAELSKRFDSSILAELVASES